MKKGIIITNAYTQLASAEYQSYRLAEEFEKIGITAHSTKNREYPCFIKDGGIVNEYSSYDFAVYLDKDKYIAEMLEKSGVRLFNSSRAISVCDDKMLTHIALAEHGIPMPDTLPGALCYTPDALIPDESIKAVTDTLGLPLVVKESYGSLGKGVYLVKDDTELRAAMEKLKCMPHMFQKYISESFGKDVRIIVIGGKYLCAMMRKSEDDFRSNIELGGVGIKITPPDEYIEIAEKASKILGLDYCGIDILIGKNGGLVCEVNSNAFFGGMEKTTGVNVAKAYAEYIASEIS